MPQHDPIKATPEELIRDLHRVVTGNGTFNKGMLYKVALANAKIGDLAFRVDRADGKIETQTNRCSDIQAEHAQSKARREGERATIAKLGKAVWENKSLVLMFGLVLLIFVLSLFNNRSTVSEIDKKLSAINKTLPLK
jgi:hypothetical protein